MQCPLLSVESPVCKVTVIVMMFSLIQNFGESFPVFLLDKLCQFLTRWIVSSVMKTCRGGFQIWLLHICRKISYIF
ncbi:hypothetical protein CS542_10780 [Pedobacter sp. IW39]|nr:hypothetical protein CS542_10780 [Pedobacter sp. IW39]